MTQRYFLLSSEYNDRVIMNGLNTQDFQTDVSKKELNKLKDDILVFMEKSRCER